MAIILYEAQINWQSYAKPWLKDNKGFIYVSSSQRSAILISDRERARFIRWLDAYLPEDATIVLPHETVLFSSQGIMQNFLYPRAILACCGSDDELCQKCLNDPNHYILAVNSFPLPEKQPGRVLVFYPQATNRLRGVYVPEGISSQLSLPDPLTYGKTTPISIQALLVDILIMGLLFLLGGLFVAALYPKLIWGDLFEYSIPLSMGILSWGIFIFSFFGIQITLLMVFLLYVSLFVFSIAIYRIRFGIFPRLPVLPVIDSSRRWNFIDGIFLFLIIFTFVVFCVVAIIAIGRGYSTGDDIVNWSFKGYAMVDSGTIWAGNRWGGHVLAYPMNLPLSIGMFRLADGDVIPGSKFLYLYLTFSLLFGCYRFLMRNNVNKIWAVMGLLALLLVPLFLFHATIGFANIPFTVYLVLGILHSLEGLWFSNKNEVLVGGLLFALAAWTRPEGLFSGIIFLGFIYLLAAYIMKKKFSFQLAFLSFIPMIIIPGSWMFLLGRTAMGNDQIGIALKTTMGELMAGKINFEALVILARYAQDTFITQRYIIMMFSIVILILSIPVTSWHRDKFKLTFVLLDVLAFLLPAFMFLVASFSEKDFVIFLDQSFDRAFLPALTMTILAALLSMTRKPTSAVPSPGS
jgi:hypothetical protein